MTELNQQRQAVVEASRRMIEWRLGHGASGNISVRTDCGMLITPTGVPPWDLSTAQVVEMDLQGGVLPGQLLPSSEWQMHSEIYLARADVHAIVHCHSRYATALACAHKTIPPLHYMVAVSGTSTIALADYATYGTPELARAALAALGDSNACLLANHGQLALGPGLDKALAVALEVEELAAVYCATQQLGGAQLLNDGQMGEVLASFASYGQQIKD